MQRTLFLLLTFLCILPFSHVHSSSRSPQEFTDKVHVSCSQNKFDEFLAWLKESDIPNTNRRLKDERSVTFFADVDPGLYRNWKEEYYTNFGAINQTKPFLFAGEIYPFIPILQSTALSFYELSPVTRICILLSGKLGNPVAGDILLFEDVDGSETLIEGILLNASADERQLIRLLKTPFAWNNIKISAFLKDKAKIPRFIEIVTQSHDPFVLLNGYFADSETGSSFHAIGWLNEAMHLGSALASIRLQRVGQPFNKALPVINAAILLQRASYCRYSSLDRKTAKDCYVTVLGLTPDDPFLHMEMAGFYKDLCIAGAYGEVLTSQQTLVQGTFYHYKQAHETGDGEAALEAIKFLKLLQKEKVVLLPNFSADWGLPNDNILECLTVLYEAAYKRRDEALFLERIKDLGQRDSACLDALLRSTMLATNYRKSIFRLSM
ncbi:MAG: hypothetical protein KBD04_03590 [Proteobacteria bacterium]|nr:hypothetical protein [Pseudomonadota bacterium]